MKALIAVLLSAAMGSTAIGGVSVAVTDSCTAAEHEAGDVARAAEAAIQGNVLQTPQDFVIHEPSGGGLGRPCARDTHVHPFNDPTGPALGSVRAASEMSAAEAKQALESFALVHPRTVGVRQSGAMPAYSCLGLQCPLAEALRRSRGFQMAPHAGGGLQPDGVYAFLQFRRGLGYPQRYVIPVVVLKPGGADWFEVSQRGVVFAKVSLDELRPNELYFVEVPEAVLTEQFSVLGLYLNTAPGSDSVLYIPTSAPP